MSMVLGAGGGSPKAPGNPNKVVKSEDRFYSILGDANAVRYSALSDANQQVLKKHVNDVLQLRFKMNFPVAPDNRAKIVNVLVEDLISFLENELY